MDVFGLDLPLNSNIFILTEATSIFKLVQQVVKERHLVGKDKFPPAMPVSRNFPERQE